MRNYSLNWKQKNEVTAQPIGTGWQAATIKTLLVYFLLYTQAGASFISMLTAQWCMKPNKDKLPYAAFIS